MPIRLGGGNGTYLTLYGTGIRNRTSLANVTVTVKGVTVPVQYAGATPGFSGLDQVNILLPAELRGKADSDVIVTVDGRASNAVSIRIE